MGQDRGGVFGGVRVQVEVWQSSHNRHEKHYFIQDGRQYGYQVDRAYLVGINPEIVSREQEDAILAILGVEPTENGTLYQKLDFGRLD